MGIEGAVDVIGTDLIAEGAADTAGGFAIGEGAADIGAGIGAAAAGGEIGSASGEFVPGILTTEGGLGAELSSAAVAGDALGGVVPGILTTAGGLGGEGAFDTIAGAVNTAAAGSSGFDTIGGALNASSGIGLANAGAGAGGGIGSSIASAGAGIGSSVIPETTVDSALTAQGLGGGLATDTAGTGTSAVGGVSPTSPAAGELGGATSTAPLSSSFEQAGIATDLGGAVTPATAGTTTDLGGTEFAGGADLGGAGGTSIPIDYSAASAPGIQLPEDALGTTEASGPSLGEAGNVASGANTVKNQIQSAADKALKYGPLALGATNLLKGNAQSKQYASQLGNIGAPQRAAGQQMIAQAQAGQINPSDQTAIDQWKQNATAQAKAYYAQAGLSDSSMANEAINQINQQAEQMHETARVNLLNTGIAALNTVDQYTSQAIQAQMNGDQAAAKQATDFLNSYGSWLRALPALTGQSQPAAK